MKMIDYISFWLFMEPRSGFLDFLACHSSVATSAPARWNALVASMGNCHAGAANGVNDNSRRATSIRTEKAA